MRTDSSRWLVSCCSRCGFCLSCHNSRVLLRGCCHWCFRLVFYCGHFRFPCCCCTCCCTCGIQYRDAGSSCLCSCRPGCCYCSSAREILLQLVLLLSTWVIAPVHLLLLLLLPPLLLLPLSTPQLLKALPGPATRHLWVPFQALLVALPQIHHSIPQLRHIQTRKLLLTAQPTVAKSWPPGL